MLRKREDIDLPENESTSKRLEMADRGSKMEFTRRSAVKSFELITDLALVNSDQWISFITLTFKENLTDLTIANKKFNEAMKRIRRKFPDFKYLGVPEFQKRGAVHYHLMTNIVAGSELMPRKALKRLWRPQTKTFVNLYYYDFDWWPVEENGISSAFTLEHVDENFSVVGYLAKYFWKNNDVFEEFDGAPLDEGEGSQVDLRLYNRIKVLHSRNLERAEISYLDSWDETHDTILRSIEMFNDPIKDRFVISTSEYVPDVRILEYKKI